MCWFPYVQMKQNFRFFHTNFENGGKQQKKKKVNKEYTEATLYKAYVLNSIT